MEKGERLSFSSISVVDELPTSKVLKNFHCHYSVQGTPDCVLLELSSREERDQAE